MLENLFFMLPFDFMNVEFFSDLVGVVISWNFLQIITVTFLLFPAPAAGSNPAGQSLTLTYKKLL